MGSIKKWLPLGAAVAGILALVLFIACPAIVFEAGFYKGDVNGLEAMKERNEKKAALLYDYLDSQDYYIAPVKKDSRSMMNVTFVTGDADLDKKFASEAGKAGLKNLKGHRSVGGMRASIYNAMPVEGVEKLVEFMSNYEKENA